MRSQRYRDCPRGKGQNGDQRWALRRAIAASQEAWTERVEEAREAIDERLDLLSATQLVLEGRR